MNLLDLFVRVSVDDEASGQMEGLSAGMIAKGNIIAEGIKTAMGVAMDAISAMVDGIRASIEAFAEYEQMVDGMKTLFGDAADTIIENAKRAYETAGMSANEYMENVTGIATKLVTDISKRHADVLEDDTEAQSKALDEQVSNLRKSLDSSYKERSRAYAKELQQAQQQYDDELDALRESLNKRLDSVSEELSAEYEALSKQLSQQVEAQREANQTALDERRKANDREYDELRDSLDKQVDAFRKATDERVKEINREYTESIKLVDEEKYERLKAIDDQIDSLNGQTEAEREAIRDRENQEKEADLRYKMENAKFAEDREKAANDLAKLLESIEQSKRESERKKQIESLKDQREIIRNDYDERKEELRQQQKDEVEQYKDGRADGLAALKAANKEQLDEFKAGLNAELDEMRKANSRQLSEMQEANARQLSEKKSQNSEILKEQQKANQQQIKEQQRANAEAISAMREFQSDQLEELRDSNNEQVNALKESVKKQKEALEEAAENSHSYVEALDGDYEEAARLADIAMRDIADNHNKLGTDMGMLEAAYSSLSRGSARMLDTLRIGYGEGKAELERMLSDAEQILAKQGEVRDLSTDSFADIVEAIHVVQENLGISGYTYDELREKISGMALSQDELTKVADDMGISYEDAMRKMLDGTLTVNDASSLLGTTVREGGETIQGSVDRVHAAWDDWLISLADPDYDVVESTENLMESVGTAAGLIVPRVAAIISTLTNYVEEHAPEIFENFKTAFIDSLPPEWKEKVEEVIGKLQDFWNKIQPLLDALGSLGEGLDETGGFFDDFAHTADEAWNVIDWVIGMITGDFKELPKSVEEASRDIYYWLKGIPDAIHDAFTGAGDWLWNAGQNIINGLWEGLTSAWEDVTSWFTGIGPWIQENKGPEQYDKNLLKPAGRYIIGGLYNSMRESFESDVMPYVSGMGDAMVSGFGSPMLSPFASTMTHNTSMTMANASQTPTMVSAVLELDRVQLGKVVFQLNGDEEQRVGVDLVGSVA